MQNATDLIGKNIIIYDLEIKNPIENCSKGWNSHDEMGISVGCAFDYRDMRYRVFMDDNMQALVDRLNEIDTLIVAFNHVGFDNKLLRASGFNLKTDEQLMNYDMLYISREGADTLTSFVKGFKLDDHLRARNLPLKTSEGAIAPLLWQQGKIGALIDYCLNDVTQERALFEDMYITGQTACAYKPDPYKIALPKLI